MLVLILLPLLSLLMTIFAQDNSTITTNTTSTSTLSLPTTPYTGQALLTGACTQPSYTPLYFADGGQVIVPLIGCSDDHPECCPSISIDANLHPSKTAPVATGGGANPEVSPTGVVALLSQHPLRICPKDFTDIDPVCCPSGYQLYPAKLNNNYPPCVTQLTSSISIPPSVLASISSAIEAGLTTTSTSISNTLFSTSTGTSTSPAQTTIDVVQIQIFALPLPCANNGLNTGAKAGIGVGVGVAGLVVLGLVWWGWIVRRKRRERREKGGMVPGGQGELVDMNSGRQYPEPQRGVGPVGGAYHDQSRPQEKYMSSMSGTTLTTPPLGSPGDPRFPRSDYDSEPRHSGQGLNTDYAQGYMHGVHSVLAIAGTGQRKPLSYESPTGQGSTGFGSDSGGTWSGPGELASTAGSDGRPGLHGRIAEMEGDGIGKAGSGDGRR